MIMTIRSIKGSLGHFKGAILAVACILCISANANAAGYEVTLVGYKGDLQQVTLDLTLWEDIRSTWGMFLKPARRSPMANVTSARMGTLTKGDFSREIVRLVCASPEDAARMVKGLNGAVVRDDGLEIGFIWMDKEITFFKGPPVRKYVQISGYKGTMAEISSFAVEHIITHGPWTPFINEGRCPSLDDLAGMYATAGILAKGEVRLSYACVRLQDPEITAPCLQNTDRLYEHIENQFLLVTQREGKLLFLRGDIPKKDFFMLAEAIPEVKGFDPI